MICLLFLSILAGIAGGGITQWSINRHEDKPQRGIFINFLPYILLNVVCFAWLTVINLRN